MNESVSHLKNTPCTYSQMLLWHAITNNNTISRYIGHVMAIANSSLRSVLLPTICEPFGNDRTSVINTELGWKISLRHVVLHDANIYMRCWGYDISDLNADTDLKIILEVSSLSRVVKGG